MIRNCALVAAATMLVLAGCTRAQTASVSSPNASAAASPTALPSPSPSAQPTAAPSLAPTVSPPPFVMPVAGSCNLAISARDPGTGGFISIPGALFTADPRSQVPYLGATPAALTATPAGLTYDHLHDKWLPVPRQWVMEDFSRYVYPAPDNSVHVVEIATGADTVLAGGDALEGYVLAIEPDGVYGVPGPLTLRRVGWNGQLTEIVTGYMSTTVVVGNGVAYGSKDSGAVHSIDRIDLTTGTSQPWFRSLSRNLRVVGVDVAGNPLIAGAAADGTTSIWHPTTASTSDEPVGQPLGSFSHDPGAITLAQGQGGFWIESTVFGLYHNDMAMPGSFGLVTTRTGFIAGPCI